MIQDKPLCYAPFIGMYATGYEQFAPCCVAQKDKYKNVDPKDYWTSTELQDMRKQLLTQEWPDKCKFCKNKREKGLKDETWIWDKHMGKVDVELDIEYGNSTKGPMFLDYRPSNVCNLKCRMCVPNASSQITKEFQEHKDMQEWFSAPDKVVNNFDAFKDFTGSIELKQIKILGGEPTMDPLVLDFLETIIDNYEILPALRFTTNGTNLNKRFRNIMEKFEDIHIVFSIDAVGDAYEYVRTNANWSKTKKIIEEIFAKDMAKIYGFNIVLMPYNMFHLTDLLDWFRTLSDKGYDFETFYDLSEGYTTEMQGVLPEHLDFLKQTLTEYSDTHQYNIDDIMDLLNSVTFKQESFDNFVRYNNRLDEIRKTSLENLDSRFKQYVGKNTTRVTK